MHLKYGLKLLQLFNLEFQEIVVRHLVQVQQNQNQIIKLLLTRKVDAEEGEGGGSSSVDFGSLPSIPAETVEQLKAVEEFLKEDANKKLMVNITAKNMLV